ncbi:sigma-70 family RNA polymerase sigma factor [Streptomyces sp. N2-109]|uniref:RNA polymerase sigma factor n=1 Tax=Streptomyces gossypii TaxID=2883101 RepID=A0ABT2JRA9_9ACTN|nr:sigma-70 family RNA polymerase sigma factor [Streptomyces gossypii]MCT2590291.1 sigma-70 family RNA polymerase sigma factor [Streptomyces gossypii]
MQSAGGMRRVGVVVARLWKSGGRSAARQEALSSLESEQDMRLACDRHGKELLGFAYSALADEQLAEDVVQETFVRAWRAADSFDHRRASLRTWLFAIARNVVTDARRRRAAREPLAGPAEEGEQQRDPSDKFDQLLTRIELDEALRRLSPEHRQIVLDVYFLGRTCADLAAELDIPASTVRSRLYYGVRALRGILEEKGWLAP